MTFGFQNPLMLLGLVAIVLPVIAHVFSRRRYDVVPWGAMRFLELEPKTRQRFHIQDLLLMLLRMAGLAALVLALAQPWAQGGWLSGKPAGRFRDVVFVLDGSDSMDWREGGASLHQQAVQWIHEALESCSPEDRCALIDARQTPRRILSPPKREQKELREALAALPDPRGSSNLHVAIVSGLQLLATTSGESRELVVLTDQQALPWKSADSRDWTQIDELLRLAVIRPRIHVVTFGSETPRSNFTLGPLIPSRERTVPEYPGKLQGRLRQFGGEETTCTVTFLVDDQPLPELAQQLRVPADGEVPFEIEYAFPASGTFIASVRIEEDSIPADNRSDAVVNVVPGLPVLIVEGDRRADESGGEAFFLREAFSATGAEFSWVDARVIPPSDLTAERLRDQQVLILGNVARLDARQRIAVRDWTTSGGGLIIAPGDQLDVDDWNRLLDDQGRPLLPAVFDSLQSDTMLQTPGPVTIDPAALTFDWLQPFRPETGQDFWETRFAHWYRLVPRDDQKAADSGFPTLTAQPEVVGRLTTGDPWAVFRELGAGRILQLAFPLDADWSSLPGRADFVPFVHELVFMMNPGLEQRNVAVGQPLRLPLSTNDAATNWRVHGPGVRDAFPAVSGEPYSRRWAVFEETRIPGSYLFQKAETSRSARTPSHTEPFQVSAESGEADLTPLTAEDWERLSAGGRLQRVQTLQDVLQSEPDAAGRKEFWWMFLLLGLFLLVAEVALARSMVRGGHAAPEPVGTDSQQEP